MYVSGNYKILAVHVYGSICVCLAVHVYVSGKYKVLAVHVYVSVCVCLAVHVYVSGNYKISFPSIQGVQMYETWKTTGGL